MELIIPWKGLFSTGAIVKHEDRWFGCVDHGGAREELLCVQWVDDRWIGVRDDGHD